MGFLDFLSFAVFLAIPPRTKQAAADRGGCLSRDSCSGVTWLPNHWANLLPLSQGEQVLASASVSVASVVST